MQLSLFENKLGDFLSSLKRVNAILFYDWGEVYEQYGEYWDFERGYCRGNKCVEGHLPDAFVSAEFCQ